jgi:DNA-directed RNA polymerase subunit RPC12/RpoP
MDSKVPKCVLCGRKMSILFMDSKAQNCVLCGRKISSIYSQDSKAQKRVF